MKKLSKILLIIGIILLILSIGAILQATKFVSEAKSMLESRDAQEIELYSPGEIAEAELSCSWSADTMFKQPNEVVNIITEEEAKDYLESYYANTISRVKSQPLLQYFSSITLLERDSDIFVKIDNNLCSKLFPITGFKFEGKYGNSIVNSYLVTKAGEVYQYNLNKDNCVESYLEHCLSNTENEKLEPLVPLISTVIIEEDVIRDVETRIAPSKTAVDNNCMFIDYSDIQKEIAEIRESKGYIVTLTIRGDIEKRVYDWGSCQPVEIRSICGAHEWQCINVKEVIGVV
ncbi:MAG: hypothetical protein ABIG20_03265 [archaeon]